MNPQDHDHPDLSAYALGELSPADAARVRQWLAQSPEASAALERIQQTIGALQAAPPLPKRALHPRQRETVLAMGQALEARPKNVVPFLGFRRPPGSGTQPSAAWRMVKFAAAACLVTGAFMMGQRTATRVTPLVAANEEPKQEATASHVEENNDVNHAPASPPAPAPVLVAEVKSEAPAPASPAPLPAVSKDTDTAPDTTPPAPKVDAVLVAEAKRAPEATSQPPLPAPVPPVTAVRNGSLALGATVALTGFAQASVSPEAELKVRPQNIRPRSLPVPHEFAGVILASPLPLDAKPAPAPAPGKADSQPALKIHNWKAEFASCPWDSSRRLMRFVVQVPVEQPGIESNDREYKLVAKFDPFHVQGFRLVTEKQMRPSGSGTLATCFAWYEIIPTRNFSASAEKPVTIGSIHVEQPKGSASELKPLPLVDKGLAWNDAREDYVFETAMIGWNMLLRGTENIGGLNSKLVLDLAEKTRGEDAKGERARFINAVKQAQRAVGM